MEIAYHKRTSNYYFDWKIVDSEVIMVFKSLKIWVKGSRDVIQELK